MKIWNLAVSSICGSIVLGSPVNDIEKPGRRSVFHYQLYRSRSFLSQHLRRVVSNSVRIPRTIAHKYTVFYRVSHGSTGRTRVGEKGTGMETGQDFGKQFEFIRHQSNQRYTTHGGPPSLPLSSHPRLGRGRWGMEPEVGHLSWKKG